MLISILSTPEIQNITFSYLTSDISLSPSIYNLNCTCYALKKLLQDRVILRLKMSASIKYVLSPPMREKLFLRERKVSLQIKADLSIFHWYCESTFQSMASASNLTFAIKNSAAFDRFCNRNWKTEVNGLPWNVLRNCETLVFEINVTILSSRQYWFRNEFFECLINPSFLNLVANSSNLKYICLKRTSSSMTETATETEHRRKREKEDSVWRQSIQMFHDAIVPDQFTGILQKRKNSEVIHQFVLKRIKIEKNTSCQASDFSFQIY